MVTLDQAGRGVADLRITAPGAQVAHLVEHGFQEGITADRGDATRAWRIVPDASPHVIYSLTRCGTGLRQRLVVVGARRVHVDIDRSPRVATAGLRLRPGTLRLLFGVSAAELTDRSTPLEDLVGAPARELLERLATSPPSHTTSLLERFVADRALRIEPRLALRAGSVQRILAARATTRVASLAHSSGISARGMRLLMQEHAGLSPKRVARVRRLHAALSAALRPGPPRWSRVALEAGYADQSHLIRDFVALLGEPPETFLRRGRAS